MPFKCVTFRTNFCPGGGLLVCLSCITFRVSEKMPLYDILNEFQKGHSHLAVVYKDLNETKETLQKTKGVNIKNHLNLEK